MPNPNPNPNAVLAALIDSLDADILAAAYSDAEVDAELREAGLDEATVARFVDGIEELLRRRRERWSAEAKERIAQRRR